MPANCVKRLAAQIGDDLAASILDADQTGEVGIREQRKRVAALKDKLAGIKTPEGKDLLSLADVLVKKSSGSSAATVGPTTSVTADSITSWPPAAT